MSSEDLTDRITKFVREEFLEGDPAGELTPDTPLLELGILNSLKTAQLLVFIRQDLGVFVPALELNAENLKNVRAISSLVSSLMAA